MKISFGFIDKSSWLYTTFYFLRKHFAVITGLGLIAAFGRVIQLEGFGEIASWMNIVLEIIIESARIVIFLYVLGLANIKNGVLRIRRLLTQKGNRKLHLAAAIQKLKKQWLSVTLSIIGFLMITLGINYLINLLAYETCLYLTLKREGILSDSASEWTILLFAKNLSVIPFMLVFEAVFLLWVSNTFQIRTPAKIAEEGL